MAIGFLSTAMGRITVCGVLVLLAPASLHGDEPSPVRTESTKLRALLTEATRQSPTIAALVDRIRASNVIAHIECQHFQSFILKGRTFFLSAKATVRYVRVQIDCMQSRQELVEIIGHELQHVSEIAAAADVVDRRSFAHLLNAIGRPNGGAENEGYETEAALLAEEQVGREVTGRGGSSTQLVRLTGLTDTPSH